MSDVLRTGPSPRYRRGSIHMVELYWPRSTTFLTPQGSYSGPDVHDIPDDQEAAFRDRGWEDPPGDEEDGEGNPGADSSAGGDDGLDPSEFTLDALEDALEDADADAETLHERESEGDDRVGAHEIIDAVVGE